MHHHATNVSSAVDFRLQLAAGEGRNDHVWTIPQPVALASELGDRANRRPAPMCTWQQQYLAAAGDVVPSASPTH